MWRDDLDLQPLLTQHRGERVLALRRRAPVHDQHRSAPGCEGKSLRVVVRRELVARTTVLARTGAGLPHGPEAVHSPGPQLDRREDRPLPRLKTQPHPIRRRLGVEINGLTVVEQHERALRGRTGRERDAGGDRRFSRGAGRNIDALDRDIAPGAQDDRHDVDRRRTARPQQRRGSSARITPRLRPVGDQDEPTRGIGGNQRGTELDRRPQIARISARRHPRALGDLLPARRRGHGE